MSAKKKSFFNLNTLFFRKRDGIATNFVVDGQALLPILALSSSFTLVVAPAGYGKTRMLLALYQCHVNKMVFVSPLRALAQEFYQVVLSLGNVFLLEKHREADQVIHAFLQAPKAMLVATPELLNDGSIALLARQRALFVLDEFHLFYYWGQSFREQLFEISMAIANSGASILGLTATMARTLFLKWQKDFLLGMESCFYLDLGNQRLRFYPIRSHFYFSRRAFIRRFLYEQGHKAGKTTLYFCRYRQEVDQWVKWGERGGINVLGCKGGETVGFCRQLALNPHPRIIFATSALSHGVNLPAIDRVFVSYPVKNRDFWVQMIGRGGRTGEGYEIFCFDLFELSWWERLKNLTRSYFFDAYLRIYFFFYAD